MFCKIIETHKNKKQSTIDFLNSEEYANKVKKTKQDRYLCFNAMSDNIVEKRLAEINESLSNLVEKSSAQEYDYMNDVVHVKPQGGILTGTEVHFGKGYWEMAFDLSLSEESKEYNHEAYLQWFEDVAMLWEKSESRRIDLKHYLECGTERAGDPMGRVMNHLLWRRAEEEAAKHGITLKAPRLYNPSGWIVNRKFDSEESDGHNRYYSKVSYINRPTFKITINQPTSD
jgi:hypothetical protein